MISEELFNITEELSCDMENLGRQIFENPETSLSWDLSLQFLKDK